MFSRKFYWGWIIAVALFSSVMLSIGISQAKHPVIHKDSDCSFAMRLKDRHVEMKLQCGKDKPVEMDRCNVKALQMKEMKDKVFLFITCCSADKFCMTVVVPTDKTIL